VVIYNSMNIIDRSAIEKLSYAVETGECARLIQSSVRITLTGLAFQHLQ
jgi:hypothetical protein